MVASWPKGYNFVSFLMAGSSFEEEESADVVDSVDIASLYLDEVKQLRKKEAVALSLEEEEELAIKALRAQHLNPYGWKARVSEKQCLILGLWSGDDFERTADRHRVNIQDCGDVCCTKVHRCAVCDSEVYRRHWCANVAGCVDAWLSF